MQSPLLKRGYRVSKTIQSLPFTKVNPSRLNLPVKKNEFTEKNYSTRLRITAKWISLGVTSSHIGVVGCGVIGVQSLMLKRERSIGGMEFLAFVGPIWIRTSLALRTLAMSNTGLIAS